MAARLTNIRKSVSFSMLVLMMITLITCLPGCEKGTEPDDPVIDIRIARSHATGPVWMPNGEDFLSADHSDLGLPAIYLSSTGDSEMVIQIWDGSHNHDYTPSPDGNKIAFSTPGTDGGVYIYDINTYQASLFMSNHRNPSWFPDSETLVTEDEEKRLVATNTVSDESLLLVEEGHHPLCAPGGSNVAYTHQPFTSSFRLYVVTAANPQPTESLADNVGLDYTWDSNSNSIYASQLADGTLSNIIKIDLQQPAPDTLIRRAIDPSVGNNGSFLLVTRINQDRLDGVLLFDLDELTSEELVGDGYFPAACPNADEALVERDDGIYHVRWSF